MRTRSAGFKRTAPGRAAPRPPLWIAHTVLLLWLVLCAEIAQAATWRCVNGDWDSNFYLGIYSCWDTGTVPVQGEDIWIVDALLYLSYNKTVRYVYWASNAHEFGDVHIESALLGNWTVLKVTYEPNENFYRPFTADNIYLGEALGGRGRIYSEWGRFTVHNDLVLGRNWGSEGEVDMHGDWIRTYRTQIGPAGYGTFTLHEDASHSANYLEIGNGVYTLDGGELELETVAGEPGSGNTIVGHYHTTGTFNHQAQGIHTIAGDLIVGHYEFGVGTYNLASGNLTSNHGRIGYYGTGTMNQTGGRYTVLGNLNIGDRSIGTGTYVLSGGVLDTGRTYVGQAGAGTFTQTGGTHETGYLSLGAGGAATGTYNLEGGSLLASIITTATAGTGEFNFTGGWLAIGEVYGHLHNEGGTLSVGSSPGSATVHGDYVHDPGATLYIELGGTLAGDGYDQLVVTGTASLAGTLDVDWWGGYQGQAGDTFDVLQAATILGQFDQVLLADLDAPFLWSMQYLRSALTPDVLRLVVTSTAPIPVPAAAWLLGSVGVLLAGLGRRRK